MTHRQRQLFATSSHLVIIVATSGGKLAIARRAQA